MENLKEKAIKASFWTMLEKFMVQFVQLIVGIILARLLEPKDYGLIAIAMIFVSISAAITDGGFEKTIIRQKDLTPIELSTIFFLNVIIGIIITSFLIVLAPTIAIFFHESTITPILQFISLAITINALGQVQSILLRKELSFKKLSLVQMVASLCGGIAGIILAYRGWGVWALAISIITTQLIMLVFYWLNSKWYPKFIFSLSSVKHMLGYGSNVVFISIIGFTLQQFNTFIVGRFFTKTDLGLFNRGNRFPDVVVNTVEGIVQKTSFPLFSKIQHSNELLANVLGKCIRLVTFISFPLLTILYMNAHNLTIYLFTEKWAGSIVFLKLFCIARFFHPLIGIYREIILVKGNAKALSRITIIATCIEVCLILIALKFGLIYIVLATFVSTIIQYLIYSFYTFKKLNFRWINHVRWLIPYLIMSVMIVIMTLISNLIIERFELQVFLKLSINLGVGIFTIIAFTLVTKPGELQYVVRMFSGIKNKLRWLQTLNPLSKKKITNVV